MKHFLDINLRRSCARGHVWNDDDQCVICGSQKRADLRGVSVEQYKYEMMRGPIEMPSRSSESN